MNYFKKPWVQTILIAIIMIIGGIFIIPIISVEPSITKLQTRIYIFQLIFGFVLGFGALYLAKEQIRLSNEQSETINKQTELMYRQLEMLMYMHNVENAKYSLNKLTNNLDTNLLQYIAGSITKYLDKDQKKIDIISEKLEKVDIGIGNVNKTIDESIKKYGEALDNKPERIEFIK